MDTEALPFVDEEIRENDYVSIPQLNIEGTVSRINGNKAHIITSDGLSFDVTLNKLHKIETPKKSSKKIHTQNYDYKINTNVGLELNIIGLRREEAKEALIKYLDNCKIKNLKQVRIIHGFGNGILRKMVHEYLDKQKIKYRLGDINEGGGGATVVTLHD